MCQILVHRARRETQVTPDVQHVHFKKYNYFWAIHCRKVKKSMRSRLRWNEDQWTANVNQCCIFVWVYKESKNDPNVTQDMLDAMEEGFLCGYLGGFDF